MKLWYGLFLLTLGEPALAALHVEVTSPHAGPSSVCTFWGDEMLLSVSEGNRLIGVRRFCSAYGKAQASTVTDASGQTYIILRHSVGHGSHASRDFLTIYSLNKRLIERAMVIARQPIGAYADAGYSYAIRTPRGGGLELIGALRVSGERSRMDVSPAPPSRVKIDAR